jgi:hypothetical protein
MATRTKRVGDLENTGAILQAPVIEKIYTPLGETGAGTASGVGPWPGAASGMTAPTVTVHATPLPGPLESAAYEG